jgi:lipopolysaccharide export system permease protein
MGRLASDNEITVMKASGISLYRLFYPIALASCAAFLTALLLSLFFLPQSNQATKNLIFSVIKQNASIGIKEKVFNDNFKGLLIYANTIPAHGKFMEGVIISDNRISKEPATIFAERAHLISDPESMRISLRLERGSTHAFDLKLRNYRKMDFSSYDINLDMEAAIAEKNRIKEKDSTEMAANELMGKIRTQSLDEAVKRELLIELNKKFTFPLACLIFGLIGMPIGVNIRKSAKARGLTIGIIIVLFYYLLQLGGTALTETGRISPLPGIWLPTVTFTIAGLYLLVSAARERTLGMENIKQFFIRFAKVKMDKK